jgi:hypothetical protein
MAFSDIRVMRSDVKPDAADIRLAFTNLAGFLDNPLADLRITAETPTASPRTVTLAVRDRLDVPWPGRWLVLFTVGETAYKQDGTHTITVPTDNIVATLVADKCYLIVTDSSGSVSIDIAAAAGTRKVSASVIGRMQASAALTIT